MNVRKLFGGILALLVMACFASPAGAVSVYDFGAIPNDGIDDTTNIQAAVNSLLPDGGLVEFPAGTYDVGVIRIWPGLTLFGPASGTKATLKRLPYQTTWCRTFTTGLAPYYSNAVDSALITIKDLDFDGNLANQGSYTGYELEHAAQIFLHADAHSPGKLRASITNCTFRECTADGIALHVNVKATIADCSATNCFRAGIAVTGAGTDATVTRFTGGGDVWPSVLDVETSDGAHGYDPNSPSNETYAVTMSMDDFHVGGFQIGCKPDAGSRFVGNNVSVDARSTFCIIAPYGTVAFSNSTFDMGDTDIRNNGSLTFQNCSFTAKRVAGHNINSNFYLPHIAFQPTYDYGHDQTVTFEDCTWTIGDGITSSDNVYAIWLNADQLPQNNQLNIINCSIGAGYDYGLYLENGGSILIQDTDMDAVTNVRLKQAVGCYYDVMLDGVVFGPHTIVTEDYYNSDVNCHVLHTDMILARSENTLNTTAGLLQNLYYEGRRIIGSVAPGTNTPGLKGDLYQLDPIPTTPGATWQWKCDLSHPTGAIWAAHQYLPAPDADLIGHWRFDEENIATNLARDSTGHGYNGALSNGPARVVGPVWRGLLLDGTNDLVHVGGDENAFDFPADQNFTFSAWIVWDGKNQTWQPVIQKGNMNANNWYFFGVRYGGAMYLYLKDGSNRVQQINAGVAPSNTWVHLAAVKDSQKIRIYLNGVEKQNLTHGFTAGFTNSYPLRLGFLSYVSPPAYYNCGFHGAIDDVRVYKRALNAGEIQDLYSQRPVVVADSGATTRDVALTLDVLANDYDPDNDVLSVASVTQPSDGSTVLNEDDTVTYTPVSGYTGTNSFTYIVEDDYGQTATGSVSVVVYDPDSDPTRVAYWALDEGNGTVATDSTGHGYDGGLSNGPGWMVGRFGSALSLDGSNDFVHVNGDENAFDFPAGQNFTLSAWIAWDGTSQTWQPVFQKGNMNANNWYFLGAQYGGGLYFKLKDGVNNYQYIAGGTAPSNTWIHLVGVKDSERIRLYVNGAQVSEWAHGFTSGFSSTYPLRLGYISYPSPPGYPNYGFHGAIDELRVYNRALSAGEIQALYNQ